MLSYLPFFIHLTISQIKQKNRHRIVRKYHSEVFYKV